MNCVVLKAGVLTMKAITNRLQALGLGLCLSGAFSPAVLHAELAAETMADFTAKPIVSADSAVPMVMIAASNDHQNFFKAYNDYADLDRDGEIETTYEHSFDYYGYFDSYRCYSHSGGSGAIFEPDASKTADKYCGGSSWSGNFLNWATMTRIDTVRKILFGGLRSTDTSSTTVLERSYLPGDAHSFAKYYQEASSGEMAKLTPWSDPEITICNTTYAADGDSEDRTEPPLLRVASGGAHALVAKSVGRHRPAPSRAGLWTRRPALLYLLALGGRFLPHPAAFTLGGRSTVPRGGSRSRPPTGPTTPNRRVATAAGRRPAGPGRGRAARAYRCAVRCRDRFP